jgi:CHAT domain-containing protein
MPPALEIVVDSMAVVVGDYASDSKSRPLPYAVQEGDRLTDRYAATRLTALEHDVNRLLSGEWRADGADGDPYIPQALHFACHGEVDLDHPESTGIILNDGNLRLTPMILRGTRLPRVARPFVFLNACQVGTATTVLSEYGGMAGAFLVEGCRAFLAPLWVVDDVVARDVAWQFYALVLDDGLPVAEAMRRIRSTFGTAAAARTATPLAYAYYGHPSLRMHRGAAADAGPADALAGAR